MHGFAQEYQGTINFVYLDVDNPQNNDLMAYLNTSEYVPELYIVDETGNVLWSNIGTLTEYELRQVLETYVSR